MSTAFWHIDAFCERPFSGNPAAVCLLYAAGDSTWMQSMAHEMNLSETAFLVAQGDVFSLRWFTPTVEVDLCGHATLASAHALWESGKVDAAEPIRFQTRSGELTAQSREGLIWLDFPALPAAPASVPPALLEALGARPVWSGITAAGKNADDEGNRNYLLVLEDASAVRALRPNFRAMTEASGSGVIVTSRDDQNNYHFISRYFAPAAGIDEDPVTGSAHCTLGPYWAEELGMNNLGAYQVSARGGEVRVRVAGDRVRLGGKAVTVVRGTLA
ncbi:MAG: PhzF family phenazine biosynthesis protein [Chloroflexota bacterium]